VMLVPAVDHQGGVVMLGWWTDYSECKIHHSTVSLTVHLNHRVEGEGGEEAAGLTYSLAKVFVEMMLCPGLLKCLKSMPLHVLIIC